MKNLSNHVQLIGRLGMDPELISLPNGNNVLRMTLATNDYRKDKEGNFLQETQWHNLKAWGGLAERMAKQLIKGALVIVSGRLEHRSWENNKGEKRRTTEITVREFSLMRQPRGTENGESSKEEAKDMPF